MEKARSILFLSFLLVPYNLGKGQTFLWLRELFYLQIEAWFYDCRAFWFFVKHIMGVIDTNPRWFYSIIFFEVIFELIYWAVQLLLFYNVSIFIFFSKQNHFFNELLWILIYF